MTNEEIKNKLLPFVKDKIFISPRIEDILMTHNLKESKKICKNKKIRFVPDLRIGTLYIIDKAQTNMEWTFDFKLEDRINHGIIISMYSFNTYNGYITNYQYEIAKCICDILNENPNQNTLIEILEFLPNLLKPNRTFTYMKLPENHILKRYTLEETLTYHYEAEEKYQWIN